MSNYECKAHLFAGKGTQEHQIWLMCDTCSELYNVENSPVTYMGQATFYQPIECDHCKNILKKKVPEKRDSWIKRIINLTG